MRAHMISMMVLAAFLSVASTAVAQPTGNDRMREISAAVQQGASAYLNRQYTTISIVGVILFLRIGLGLKSWSTAVGFAVGAVLSAGQFRPLLNRPDNVVVVRV